MFYYLLQCQLQGIFLLILIEIVLLLKNEKFYFMIHISVNFRADFILEYNVTLLATLKMVQIEHAHIYTVVHKLVAKKMQQFSCLYSHAKQNKKNQKKELH